MRRRLAIKRIALSFSSISISSGIISMVQSCKSSDAEKSYKFFNPSQISFLDKILEIILPETDSPGATNLKLSKFVDAYVNKNIKSEDQKYLLDIMNQFIELILDSENLKSSNQLSSSSIEKYFADHIDNESMVANDGKNYSQLCDLFREMAVNSYRLSEYVMTNKLGYVPVPGYYDGNVDV
tara:strand:- start:1819 stop:2364 length:546 start_codon:yes stop_codon:yes gene_type:complete